MAAEYHGLDVAHRDVERFGEEGAVARRVQQASHAEYALARKARGLHRDIAHDVERIADDDEDRLGRRLRDLLGHRLHDAGVGVEEVVARHARFAGDAGGDDDDVRVLRLLVSVCADDARVEAFDRGTLPLIEALPLGDTIGDIHHDDEACELLLRDALRSRGADVTGSDDGDLVDHVSNV